MRKRKRVDKKVMPGEVKREVAKAKKKVYYELFESLDHKEGEKDLYPLARQSDQAVEDVQQVQETMDRDGNVLSSDESFLRRWKEQFKKLRN